MVEKCSWDELNNGNTRSRKVGVGAREDGLLNSGLRGRRGFLSEEVALSVFPDQPSTVSGGWVNHL